MTLKTSTDLKFSWRHRYVVSFRHFTDIEVCRNMDAWLWLPNVLYPGRARTRQLCITASKAPNYKPACLWLSHVRRRKWVYSFVVTGDTAAPSVVSSNVNQLESYAPYELQYAVWKRMRHFSLCQRAVSVEPAIKGCGTRTVKCIWTCHC